MQNKLCESYRLISCYRFVGFLNLFNFPIRIAQAAYEINLAVLPLQHSNLQDQADSCVYKNMFLRCLYSNSINLTDWKSYKFSAFFTHFMKVC